MTLPVSPGVHGELARALGALEEAALVTDFAGGVLFANPAMARLVGVASLEEMSRAEWTRRILLRSPDGQSLSFEHLPELLAREGQAPPPLELLWQARATGEERWLTATATPLAVEGGRAVRILTVFRDVTALRRADQALRYLAEASAVLDSSLASDATLEALARLTVPALADWCSVDLIEPDGACRQVGAAHVDPAQVELIRALRGRYPLRVDSPSAVGQVLRTGKPLLVPQITEEGLRGFTADPEDQRLLAALGLVSTICVPLIARGRMLGILRLYTGRAGRRLGEADLALAVELANRAALAVDNARLYEETRAALRRKDEEARLNETLRRLGNAFASELDTGRLAELIVEEATALLEAHHGAFSYRGMASREGVPLCHIFAGELDASFEERTRGWAPTLFGGVFDRVAVLRGGIGESQPHAEPAARGTPTSLMAAPVFSRSGRVMGVLSFSDARAGAFTDQHERALQGIASQAAVALDNAHLFQQLREAEERIRASGERLRIAMAAGQMGYFEMDVRSRRVTLAPRFEEMLGMAAGSFDGDYHTVQRHLHPEDAHVTREWIRSMLQQRVEGGAYVFRAVHPDGSVHWIETYSQLVRDGEGQPVQILGIGMEVTERYEAQERVRQLVDELKRSNAELEQFAYVASHDLQEPLRMVASYTQLLARRYASKLDGDADEFIRYAVDGVSRMKRLINDLLTYSRVGTRGKPSVPVSFRTILDRVLESLADSARQCEAKISVEAAFPVVLCDELQLEQLLHNLLGNALKFRGDRQPRVHVGAQQRDGEWTFSVTDNGIGIDSQYFARIFVIFQRLHTLDAYPGTGIGLAVCKRIVERHGGRIWVESVQGEGSTFFFTLPAATSGSRPSLVAGGTAGGTA